MNEPISKIDEQLRDTPRVSLAIAIEMNRAKRNACLFFAVISTALVLFFSWNMWLLVIPAALGIGTLLFHMNIVIVSSELKRRAEESGDCKALGFGNSAVQDGIGSFEESNELFERCVAVLEPFGQFLYERLEGDPDDRRFAMHELDEHRQFIDTTAEALALATASLNNMNASKELRASAARLVAANAALYRLTLSRYVAALALVVQTRTHLVNEYSRLDSKMRGASEDFKRNPNATVAQRKEMAALHEKNAGKLAAARTKAEEAQQDHDRTASLLLTVDETIATLRLSASLDNAIGHANKMSKTGQ